MDRLCSNCSKVSSQNDYRSNLTDIIPDPICQALKNLQAKIRVLEIQRIDDARNGSNYLEDVYNNNQSNQNNTSQESHTYPACNHSTVIVPDELHHKDPTPEGAPVDNNDVSCLLEKNLASEALKMAEKRCVMLENQLSAMKRLFLRKLTKDPEPSTVNEPVKGNISTKRNTLTEKLCGSRIMNDIESICSFNYDAAEDLISDSESEWFNTTLPCYETREHQKDDFCDKMNQSFKGRSEKTYSNVDPQSRPNQRFKNPPYQNGFNRIDQPFILGGSTSTSYNANTKKRRQLRNIASGDGFKPSRKVTNGSNSKNVAESTISNLRSIYSELCCEYESLLNKKVRLLESVTRVKGKELHEQRQQLTEITQSLPVKRQQIHKMKTLITNFNDTIRCDYSNVRWDI